MDLGIAGETALVTGSTAGIGLGVATGLAREGANVIVNGRTQERVDAAIAAILQQVPGATVSGVATDVFSSEGAAAIIAANPSVDILVNNAGLFAPGDLGSLSDDDWMAAFNNNVLSAIRLSRHYLPQMIEKKAGRIIVVSSEAAVQVATDAFHYSTTKAALFALSRGMAEMTKGSGVTVNTVIPGPTNSEGFGGAMGYVAQSRGMTVEQLEQEFFQFGRPSSLLGHFASVESVANLIIYLCGQVSSATNGAALRVEGGILRNIL